jgi:hypothetical protein
VSGNAPLPQAPAPGHPASSLDPQYSADQRGASPTSNPERSRRAALARAGTSPPLLLAAAAPQCPGQTGAPVYSFPPALAHPSAAGRGRSHQMADPLPRPQPPLSCSGASCSGQWVPRLPALEAHPLSCCSPNPPAVHHCSGDPPTHVAFPGGTRCSRTASRPAGGAIPPGAGGWWTAAAASAAALSLPPPLPCS